MAHTHKLVLDIIKQIHHVIVSLKKFNGIYTAVLIYSYSVLLWALECSGEKSIITIQTVRSLSHRRYIIVSIKSIYYTSKAKNMLCKRQLKVAEIQLVQ